MTVSHLYSASQSKSRCTKIKYEGLSTDLRAAPASRSERSVLGSGWTGRSPSVGPVYKKKIDDENTAVFVSYPGLTSLLSQRRSLHSR